MTDAASHLGYLADPRLAAHATGAVPVWLWSTDATRILWANPLGAAMLDAPTPMALAARRLDPGDRLAAQVTRLIATLRLGATGRLERLRGLGTGLGRALTCVCSRIVLADHTSAVLVIATEPAGPSLALAERVRRLYDDLGLAVAAFAPDGRLIHATAAGRARLGAHATLASLGAARTATDAMASGRAEGVIAVGHTSVKLIIDRLGAGATTVLAARFAAEPPEAAPAAAAPPRLEARSETAAPATPDGPAPSGQPASPPNDAPVPPPRVDVPMPDRRHPLRFVWQMDAAGRFTLGSEDFTEMVGPGVAVRLGRPWKEVAEELALDPEDQVARAISTRVTWSGIILSWPIDGTSDRLKVELSGLPIFDGNRNFLGYRGFGMCRDIDRVATRPDLRQPTARPAAPAQPPSTNLQPPAEAASQPDAEVRPALTVVPAARNVVPFRTNAPAVEPKAAAPTPVERNAFHELARQLTARLNGEPDEAAALPSATAESNAAAPAAAERLAAEATPAWTPIPTEGIAERPLLDRVPVGILVYRLDTLLYANRAFLDWTGHDSLDTLAAAGGLDNLFVEGGDGPLDKDCPAGRTLAIATRRGDKLPVEARLFSVSWDGESALALMLMTSAASRRRTETDAALRLAEGEAHEFKSILDTVTDGVIVTEPGGRIVAANRSAEALFGYNAAELAGRNFADLFAPASRGGALDYLASLARRGGLINDGREITGLVRQGGPLALFMTLGRIADDSSRICAVFRDITSAKKTESDLSAARAQAAKASAAKSELLARISHEIRTPLNSVIGFTEVMLEERFGPIGNERYRDYLKDVRASGDHVLTLLSDLLDLAKIESGRLDLTFANLNLNELVQGCVALMQPQANRERIIIRSSLSPRLRAVVGDARAVRQIVLNLLSNSIRLTGAGGQVIISTAQAVDGEVMLRVRDTGIGMDDKELAVALEPFRQLATSSRWGSAGTGLGLPLTKALAEANRARFTITSRVDDGTLVEVAFPVAQVPAA
ncbi:MAG TPA: PAS domain-containing sensor histidine kinase [Xanthobacteraceae bacterium]|nr:PAS domain-containing sensor histidine kinase [Xanthobacteraceae bacterium]